MTENLAKSQHSSNRGKFNQVQKMVPLRINDRIFGDDRKYDKIKNQPTLAIFQEAEMSDMSRKWSY